MSPDYTLLATLKRNDAHQQIVALIAVIVLFFIPKLSVWSFYLLAISQCFSCFYWNHFFRKNDCEQYRPALKIRKLFFIVLAIHALCLILFPLLFFLLIVMVFVGPILGTGYLVITMKEIIFYKNLSGACNDKSTLY